MDAGRPLAYTSITTPVGTGFLAFSSRGVVALSVGGRESEFVDTVAIAVETDLTRGKLPASLEPRISRGLAGYTKHPPVDLSRLRPFHRDVLECTAEIPRGEVRSYSRIATEIGRPRAARAVGHALSRNPVPLLIPCHRVVHEDGSLGRYGMGGPAMKLKLLTLEGALDEVRNRRRA